MAQNGDDTFNRDVEKAVKTGSDFSQGGEFAYKALMSELAHDQKKYATDPAKFDELGKNVAAGLEKTGHIDDHMLRWSRDNMGRFDTSGDGVDKQEMNPHNPTAVSGFERAMMQRLQTRYEALNKSDSIQAQIGSRDPDDSFSQENFRKLVDAHENQRQDAVPAVPISSERHEKPANREVAPAAKPFEAPKPIPEVVMPEIKLDGDLAKTREAFAKSAAEHFQARAIYTVRPGQGWDRIARDVLRQEKDGSHTNEHLVVVLSDHVAKGNGWEGRLDPTKMLHPGDKVRVMTDEAVKARTEDMLKQFDAKVAEMQKAAAAKPVDNGDPLLFDGKRSGEGDVEPPAAIKKDTTAADPVLFNGKRSGEGDVIPAPAIEPVQPAGTNPLLKASNDNNNGPVVADTAVAAPGEDFTVTAVSAEAKADADYLAKQKAASDRRLIQGRNPLETFETPDIG